MIKLLSRFQERKAESRARKEFMIWQKNNPREARILGLIDNENRHALASLSNMRRLQLLEAARVERRKMEIRDELVEYVVGLQKNLENRIDQDPKFIHTPEEFAFIQKIRHGFLLRSGFLTPALGRPITRIDSET